jgi:thiazole/oxazole-forming peptide maturase SagC family component
MSNKLKLMPFQVIEMEDKIILKRGVSTMVIPDKSAMVVIRVIQKALTKANYTAEELASLFSGTVRELILNFIDGLLQRKYIVTLNDTNQANSENPENAQDIFYWHFNLHQAEVSKQLNEKTWAFVGINELNKRMLTSIMKDGKTSIIVVDDPSLRKMEFFNNELECIDPFWHQTNIRILSDDDFKKDNHSVGFIIAASEFGSFYLLEEWNKYAVENKIPFYPAVLQNMVGYAGPLVIPNNGACLECLKHRQNSNNAEFNEKRDVERFAFENQHIVAYHQSMLTVLAEVAIFDIIKFTNNIKWEVGVLCEIDLLSGNMVRRKLIKAPRCRTCSSAFKTPAINIKKQMTSDESWKEIEQTVGYEEE